MNDIELHKALISTFKNSEALIKEATFLKDNSFFQRSYTLYQFAIEEVGKCNILLIAIMDYYLGKPIDETYLNCCGFKCHKRKTKASLSVELLAIKQYEKHIGKETNLRQEILNDDKNINTINDNKNNSLYIHIENGKFYSPFESIFPTNVENIKMKAQIRVKSFEPLIQPLEKIKAASKLIAANAAPQ